MAAIPSALLAQVKDDPLAAYDAKIKPHDRRHWSFQPVVKPVLPKVKNAAWVRNPIDAFVLANLEADGWKPAEPAPSAALLRRIHLDLAGLPPTLAEQEAFLKNPAPAAVDKIVDDLLARPTHGERWARHWLDVVRYAETAGYERDAAKPFVWRYRDYVIRALNDDKPFDRFILEQLAGDELEDANADTMIAAGFLRLGPWDDEPADPKEDRFDQLDDVVQTTSLAFLGLTLGCARCHDHKFEALTMHDYYRMVAVFDALHRPQNGRTELALPAGTRAELAKEKWRDRQLGLLGRTQYALQTGGNPAAFLEAARVSLVQQFPDLPRGYFLHESSPKASDTHLLLRGKAARPGPKVDPGVPAVLVKDQPPFLAPDQKSTRRRLTLAKWIADPKNPLTARVIVNRVWHYHFGEGIVRTPNDFGVMGAQPTHPELLDWLAHWFVDNGWSLKKLHRLILASNTYRMSKTWNKEYAQVDPDNQRLWRFPYRRLEVEAIRDSVLAVSGKLNSKMYGPWMYPEVPKEALAGSSDPDKIWKAFDEEEASRRTIYAHIKRSFVVPLLETLDLCDTTRSAEKRLTTTVAPQALTLFNGEFVERQAKHFASRLVREAADDASKQIGLAYRIALCRQPSAKEEKVLSAFLLREREQLEREQPKLDTATRARLALEQACRVIFNLNEFVYPD
ncbi:MAG: DUF1549 and DUF1553 domain-containing protein [Gemmataceae bacterium]|nr:DUF1549 and DUF1553 domain-containing protein [Gemmataceae bacterium]